LTPLPLLTKNPSATASVIIAAAGRAFAGDHTVDYRGGAAYTGTYLYRVVGAIPCARAALHAPVPVGYECLFAAHGKDRVRANFYAPAATCAIFLEKLKARDVRQIFHNIPISVNLKAVKRTMDITAPAI
jgi:hypothetical protein